ncbi:anti-sigma factor domain-containing protein [Streptomyces sp. NPDC057376]|uniref:anti-sigma factor n=1 Tax=unclassified Streptomyces TaxID=2593676 RepID=UPI00093A2E44|nr:anti-sigma factor [Streptomyces sp. CB02414]OKI85720.1 anti-sigma factor [Streptomyces sp. CB02414]
MRTDDLHSLTGAYALHALPDDERTAFERHLGHCGPCEQESLELAAAAARLGLATTVTPGPVLKERVLRRITAVRQVPPGGGTVERARRVVPRGRGLARWALAACVAAAAGLGGTTVWQYQRAEDAGERAARAEQRAGTLAGVLAAPDAESRTARLAGGATGTLIVSEHEDRAVFLASGMAEPPQGKVYQLWFDDHGTMRPAGLMEPGRTSQAVLMEGAVDGAAGVGITVEPSGGSEQPTSAPIALMNMPA